MPLYTKGEGYANKKINFGTKPDHYLEVSGSVVDDLGYSDCFIVGIGARINSSDDFTTLRLYYRQIIAGTTSLSSTVHYANFRSDPNHSLETNVYTDQFGTDGEAINKKSHGWCRNKAD